MSLEMPSFPQPTARRGCGGWRGLTRQAAPTLPLGSMTDERKEVVKVS
jgi:hypothetical protein